jgi:hypothetical protein
MRFSPQSFQLPGQKSTSNNFAFHPVPSEDKPVPVSSSVPAIVPAEQESLFRQVLEQLTRGRIPFVVAGAFAMREHTGICRFTKDLDLFLPAEYVPAALQILQREGFRCEIPDPVWLAKAHQGEFFVDLISGMSNAVVVVDRTWVERGVPKTLFGVSCHVLAPEELIASKLFVTRRERFDGADIAHVVFCSGKKIDWWRLLELAGEHWEMLLWSLILFQYVYPARPDIVPRALWDHLLERLRQRIADPDLRAAFRGSLIDGAWKTCWSDIANAGNLKFP